ncbi:hypothetical protein DPMN_025656 [Dreissena polymorpha]|uniref:Uncharacterized protein n=1 Tax=Dreissena polymorpha TaxID=45954 RepID=A0A9D4LRW8_DREPO|nr:hypothetical protein DPMN_025656 [Dreissena polymorpha]
MAPKKVKINAGNVSDRTDGKSTKSSKSVKSVETVKSKADNVKDISPIKRSSNTVGRAGDLRKQRDEFSQQIEKERREQEEDINRLLQQITHYRKDNDKLIRQQQAKYGLTLDTFKQVQEDLDLSRSTNDELYRHMESRKEECDKLQIEMDTVIQKINDAVLMTADLQREKRLYEKETAIVAQNEMKILKLTKSNKELRQLLIQNRINPTADASLIKARSTSPRGHTGDHIGHLPPPSHFKKVYSKDNLMSFKTETELRPLRRPPNKRLLRRARSLTNGTKEHVSAREFFTTRRDDSKRWTRVIEVFV